MIKNKEFSLAIKAIKEAHYILILTHKNPDADTLCSALTLSNYLFENKKKHKIFNKSDQLPFNLNFLPKFDKITNQLPLSFDLVIYVDCANEQRVDEISFENVLTINIDHHQSNKSFADINLVNPLKGSTAEILFDFFTYNNLLISKNMAMCLYVGIYDDNIAFMSPRTSANTFQVINQLVQVGIDPSYIASKYLRRDSLAKYRMLPKILDTLEIYNEGVFAMVHLENQWLNETGALYDECDEVINMILNIGIVQIAAYIREINGLMRVSLRSKKEIDVSKIASTFQGGGHKNSAGLSMESQSIKEAKLKLLDVVKNYI